jgi:hypothetical protein
VATATVLHPISNDAKKTIELNGPYVVEVTIEGMAPFLYHRWSVEAVEAKANAAKGSKAKKEDNIETYVYRNIDGELCIPSEQLRMSLVNAAKYKQDPRSPRKSAMDITKAGIVCLDELCSTGKKIWDFIDQRRVVVQRNSITRSRPALLQGWTVTCHLQVILPQYLSPPFVNDLCQQAGALCGVGDFRPTYGRFQVVNFSIL